MSSLIEVPLRGALGQPESNRVFWWRLWTTQMWCGVRGFQLAESVNLWRARGWDQSRVWWIVPMWWSSYKNLGHQVWGSFPRWQCFMHIVIHWCWDSYTVLTLWGKDNWKGCVWYSPEPYFICLLLWLI